MPATAPLPDDLTACENQAGEVGYPLILKASWGGGRGTRVLESESESDLDTNRRFTVSNLD
ncbi:pyruvate carboxylase [Burkholderia lata]|nr:pyruvate carboxylase [Burkholderia lata]